MYTIGYHELNIFGPVYNRLLENDLWEKKQLVPATGREHARSFRRRQALGDQCGPAVKWHSGEDVHRDRREVHLGYDAQQGLYQPHPAAMQGGVRLSRRLQGHRPMPGHG